MPAFDYQGAYAYHVILTAQNRAPIFADEDVGKRCAFLLAEAAEKTSLRLLAYSFMPDHVHILVLGASDSANLLRFVQRFKQVTSYQCKRDTGRRLWQQSFYDRTLRTEEDLGDVARYVFGNAVRAGLVESDGQYSLSGGEYFEPDEAKAPSLLPPRQSESNG